MDIEDMEDTEDIDYYYVTPCYLGTSGITMRCAKAMAAVLMGPFRPKKITMVSLRDHRDHDGVMFVAWDWPSCPDLVIIPDGFGTHGGEGGCGLSAVLGLIRFYGVPLEHVIVEDYNRGRGYTMFDEMARKGKISKSMMRLLLSARAYNWRYYEVDTVRLVRKGGKTYIETEYIPFSVPSLLDQDEGKPPTTRGKRP